MKTMILILGALVCIQIGIVIGWLLCCLMVTSGRADQRSECPPPDGQLP